MTNYVKNTVRNGHTSNDDDDGGSSNSGSIYSRSSIGHHQKDLSDT